MRISIAFRGCLQDSRMIGEWQEKALLSDELLALIHRLGRRQQEELDSAVPFCVGAVEGDIFWVDAGNW